MNYSKIAVRYAKAVFLLAEEKSLLKEVASDMQALLDAEKQVPELADLYQMPVLSPQQKKNILLKAFEGQFSDITHRFLDLIISNKRESHISGVARNFLKRYREHLGIKSAQLTTVVEISENQKQQIIDTVKASYKADIDMELNINPDLIGGFVLKVEDTQYDASIVTQLKNIKKELLQ